MIRKVHAYKSADGKLFESRDAAVAHVYRKELRGRACRLLDRMAKHVGESEACWHDRMLNSLTLGSWNEDLRSLLDMFEGDEVEL